MVVATQLKGMDMEGIQVMEDTMEATHWALDMEDCMEAMVVEDSEEDMEEDMEEGMAVISAADISAAAITEAAISAAAITEAAITEAAISEDINHSITQPTKQTLHPIILSTKDQINLQRLGSSKLRRIWE